MGFARLGAKRRVISAIAVGAAALGMLVGVGGTASAATGSAPYTLTSCNSSDAKDSYALDVWAPNGYFVGKVNRLE